jgi:ABC-type tungstate transport system permease subunit
MNHPLTDPRELRKLMLEVSRGSQTIGASILREVFVFSERQGYSGEDKMTLLAYRALLELENVTARLIELHNMIPHQQTIVEKETPK